jgi:hypothetical protein
MLAKVIHRIATEAEFAAQMQRDAAAALAAAGIALDTQALDSLAGILRGRERLEEPWGPVLDDIPDEDWWMAQLQGAAPAAS